MLVLTKYGYMGWMAPQDMRELLEASQDLINRYGDKATEDLLRVHPDYEVIRTMPNSTGYSNFNGATDSEGILSQKIFEKIDRRILIATGVFILAYLLID